MSTVARFVILALAVGLGAGSIGCRAQVRATATVSEPDLVLVEGDVWVVENYNEPVFYTEGYYWRWAGGVWYRSTVHTGNWIQVTVVPAPIQRIPKPEVYVHYTAPAGAEKRKGPPDHAPAHGVRGDEPGHEAGGPPGHEGMPPGHDMATPPGHEGTPPGHDKAPGPPMKEEKPAKEEKPGKETKPAKEEKAGPPAKEAKPADKGPPAKEDKAKPEKKDEKAPPAAKEEKPAKEKKK